MYSNKRKREVYNKKYGLINLKATSNLRVQPKSMRAAFSLSFVLA